MTLWDFLDARSGWWWAAVGALAVLALVVVEQAIAAWSNRRRP